MPKNAKKDKKRKKREAETKEKLRKVRVRLRKERAKEQPSLSTRYPNGKAIEDMMKQEKIKGDYRDYVMIFQDRITDYRGSYNIRTTNDEKVGTERLVLMHKRNLRNIIGEEASRQFWHPQVGRVVDVPPATKPAKEK
jgi:predicted S18 family serine protease